MSLKKENGIIRICTAMLLCIAFVCSYAQKTQIDSTDSIAANKQEKEIKREEDSNIPLKNNSTTRQNSAWSLIEPLGMHTSSSIDTAGYNYQKQSVPSMLSAAFATTGNLGCPGQNEIFFERYGRSSFFLGDALLPYTPTLKNEKFYNVYIPMTLLSYNTGGNKRSTQDRLRATFAANVNRRIGVGAKVDYLHSKGAYENQAAKHFNFGFQGYYKGDRYEMQAFFNHYHMLHKENGGITDDLYITNPAELQGGVSKIEPKSIPTNLTHAHSRINGMELYMNHAYNVGYWKQIEVNDTLQRNVYVPMIKFIWTFDYKRDRHLFLNDNSSDAQKFWTNHYLNLNETKDNTLSNSIRNTVGIQMIEGFRKWAKFGLSAYATYEWQKFNQTSDDVLYLPEVPDGLTPLPAGFYCPQQKVQNLLWIGGQLMRRGGRIIGYQADARFGLIGDVVGDIDISGRIDTRFRLFQDTVQVSAGAFFRNTEQPYLLKHYISNHFAWDNDFSKTKDLRVWGEIFIPWSNTQLKIGFENINDYVPFNSVSLPVQHKEGVRLFFASLNQKLRFGIWNWDNTLTYQTSSKQNIISLPTFSVYSNMYLNFMAFKVLDIQFGIDCNYNTRYYAPIYQPATMTFCNQQEKKIGNYPFMNAYLTCKLKKARFYLLWSHVNQGWFSKEYFSMPGYPLNPRTFQIGISVDFAN